MDAKVDPKTKKPGISSGKARKAAGRAKKENRMSSATRFFGFGQVETHDRKALAEERDKQYLLPG
ncbi:MAG: hypothetical protein A3B13_02680 [Candidatus Liptonbacteria bacterium RIFCSPLOWO2_01_FULL_45_15]|uniref:Uncharacterized protein n=1 Tax=Candidatus Liptonbacteria bacterium RIFCSPLOWO2_01_FULL_45_15 TaxID=1798649 RepID=A0A1G2CHU6_9BACT|nr:MAG: hypothetical protein A3B13_02680 [Candidatus Liptonbacteria bacterium RIFCSPLOWO2_01_FULL_45_15]